MSRRSIVLVVLPFVFASCSSAQVTARLVSTDDDRVIGVAVLRAAGEGTRAIVNVADLEPDASVRGVINAGTCTDQGASFLPLPELHADREGRARASGRLRFRGSEDVALRELADGEHVVRLFTEDADVACGTIPRI